MMFYADEGLDYQLVFALRNAEHHVDYAAEDIPTAKDSFVLGEAVRLNAVLLTKDKDFGEIVIRHQQLAAGVVLIRIEAMNIQKNVEYVIKLLDRYANELPTSFTVIQEDKIRIRRIR